MCTVCDIDMGIRESWLAFYNLYLGSGWVAGLGLGRLWHWWPAVSWSLWRHFNVWCFELSELSWWLLADNVDRRGEMVSQATGHWAHVSVSPPSHPAFYLYFPFCVISQPAPGRCSVVAAESTDYKIQDVSDNVWNLWRDLRPACCNHGKYRKFKCSWHKTRRGIHVPVFELFISWKVNVIILWPLSTIYRNREQYNRPGICVTVEPCLCYHSWGGHSSSCVKRFCLLASLHQVI